MQEASDVSIVYCDSNDIVRRTMSSLLTQYGYQVTSFATGTELLEYFFRTLEQHIPTIIMIDIYLSDIDGREAAKTIREYNPLIKLVVFSGHGQVLRSKSIFKGFDVVLQKPMHIKELDSRLKKLANVPASSIC
jgi:CheY-like chemotaxis protein